MDYQFIKVFLTSYSLPTLIIAFLVATLSIIVDKLFKGKLPFFIKNYAPFMLSLVLYFIYDTAFVLKAFVFREDTFISGVLSGSLSLIFSRTYYYLISGEMVKSPTVTVIESLLEGIIPEQTIAVTATAVESLIITFEDSEDQPILIEKISQVIKENSDKENGEIDALALASLILNAVSVL
jgi:hypothetical protein